MARVDFDTYVSVSLAFPAVTIADDLFCKGLESSTGSDGEVKLVDAHKWFNLAALKGNEEALRYRREISEELSASEIAEAQKAAREWIQTH